MAFVRGAAPLRCCALTKAGQRCGITAKAELRDSCGQLVAEPLRRGGRHCRFHICLFQCEPCVLGDDVLLFFLDLETTGLSLERDEIVEIGVVSDACGAVFGTVVRPRALPTIGKPVHGIEDVELSEGPAFEVAFARLVCFIDQVHSAVARAEDDTDEEVTCLPPRLLDEAPAVLIAAHNGMRFDFPMLLSQCQRRGVSLIPLERWHYVDSLTALRALDAEMHGGCIKLQCLVRGLASDGLRAHRALDDSLALRDVTRCVAGRLGLSTLDLLLPFAYQFDAGSSVAELSVLLDGK